MHINTNKLISSPEISVMGHHNLMDPKQNIIKWAIENARQKYLRIPKDGQ